MESTSAEASQSMVNCNMPVCRKQEQLPPVCWLLGVVGIDLQQAVCWSLHGAVVGLTAPSTGHHKINLVDPGHDDGLDWTRGRRKGAK